MTRPTSSLVLPFLLALAATTDAGCAAYGRGPGAGGTSGGHAGGTSTGGNGGAPGESDGGGSVVGLPPLVKGDLVPFSYVYDDSNPNAANFVDHTCFSYDPALATNGRTPYPMEKKDFGTGDGHFVDHCPTEGVVATCDDRKMLQSVRYFYGGKGAADLNWWEKTRCVATKGTFTWSIPVPTVPKPPLDRGPFVIACDFRVKPPEHGGECQELLPTADKDAQSLLKTICDQNKLVIERCPTDGMKGRCEWPTKSLIYYEYDVAQTALTMKRLMCEKTGGAWSEP
jgi:hypothetical protein